MVNLKSNRSERNLFWKFTKKQPLNFQEEPFKKLLWDNNSSRTSDSILLAISVLLWTITIILIALWRIWMLCTISILLTFSYCCSRKAVSNHYTARKIIFLMSWNITESSKRSSKYHLSIKFLTKKKDRISRHSKQELSVISKYNISINFLAQKYHIFHFQNFQNKNFLHCTENHIFFFQTSWKDGLSKKKLHWNMIFLVLSGKIFLFIENMILPLRRKMKDDLSQKSTWKYDIFFKHSENTIFSKRAGPGHDLSSIIWKDGIFFRKHDIFSLGGKWEMIFLKNYMEIWYFLCTRTGVTNVAPGPSAKKKSKMVLSWTNTPKGHWRSRLTF